MRFIDDDGFLALLDYRVKKFDNSPLHRRDSRSIIAPNTCCCGTPAEMCDMEWIGDEHPPIELDTAG